LLLALIYFAKFCYNLSYKNFIDQTSYLINKNKAATIISNYVGESRFEFLKLSFFVVFLICILLYFLYLKNAKYVEKKLLDTYKTIALDCKKLFTVQCNDTIIFSFCLLFITVHSLYFISTWALQYDECWSYNYFINKNIWFSFLTPNNNHNGFTLSSWFFNKLPIPTKYSYRIVALLFGILSLIAYRKLSALLFEQKTHAFSLILFVSSMPFLYYSIIARAYSATIFFFILGLLCLKLIDENIHNKKFWKYLVVTQAIGIFYNPTYLYAAATIFVGAFLICKLKNISIAFKNLFFFIILVLILISIPLIMFNGIKPLLAVVSKSASYLYTLEESPNMLVYYFSSFRKLGFVLYLIIALLLFTYYKNKQKNILFYTIALFIPVLACMLQQQILFERIFTYLTPIVAICFTIIISKFIKNQNVHIIIALVFLSCNIYLFKQHFLFQWNVPLDKAVLKTANILLEKNIDSVYLFDNYAKPGLEFYYAEAGKKLQVQMNSSASIDYSPLDSNSNPSCYISNIDFPYFITGKKKILVDSILLVQYSSKN
jgi:hypothetical protein